MSYILQIFFFFLILQSMRWFWLSECEQKHITYSIHTVSILNLILAWNSSMPFFFFCFPPQNIHFLGSFDISGGSAVKYLSASAGDKSLIPGSARFPGERNDNSVQYFCLGNFMDRGAWWTVVHGVTKSWTWLSDWTTTTKSHPLLEDPFSHTCRLLSSLLSIGI